MIALYKSTSTRRVTYDRREFDAHVYVEVRLPEFDGSVIRPQGSYYFLMEDGVTEIINTNEQGEEVTTQATKFRRVNLDSFRASIPISQIEQIEEFVLPPLTQSIFVIDALIERVKQFTLLRIDQEQQLSPGTNWGLTSADLEEV